MYKITLTGLTFYGYHGASKAEKELGISFDIRKFHDVVLGNGALPLDMLEKQVLDYISKVQQ